MVFMHGSSGGATGGGGGALWFFLFYLFLLVSSAVGHRHDNTPTPLLFFWETFLKSEKNVSESPPPPPPPTPRWATFSGLAENFWARAAVARHFAPPPPPPKQTPWRRPCMVVKVFQLILWWNTLCIKKVIHIQRPVVLKLINFNICIWPISKEQLIFFPLAYHFASCMSCMTEYSVRACPTFCKLW